MNLKVIAGTNQLAEGQKAVNYENANKGNMISQLSKEILADDMRVNTSVYPNPTYGKATIQISNANISTNDIIITDVAGRVYSLNVIKKINSNRLELDLSNFAKGVYFIKIKVGNTFKIFRVVKL
jgi:hypothetical protein